MPRASLRWSLLRQIVLGLAACGVCGCRSATGPSRVFGTYRLTSCQPDTVSIAVPCQLPNPGAGDSLRVYGSTLTLNSDSTWTNIWDSAQCWGGVWSSELVDTLYGTFHAIPGDGSAFQMWTLPGNSTFGSAVIKGTSLDLYSRWTYQR